MYATISLIDTSATTDLSFITNCSPIMNLPVVSDTAISFAPVVPAFDAAYPIAPLARPLTLEPFTTFPLVKELHFRTVNV